VELEPADDQCDSRAVNLLSRLWQRAVGEDVAAFFPIALHRFVLGGLLTVALLAQVVLSTDLVAPEEFDRERLLAEESDANSVVAVQRDSFNVALALSEWGHGAVSARDVQIARALLGKRLSVVTRSGLTSSQYAGPSYRDALLALDTVILQLADTGEGQRLDLLADADETIDTFLTETRALSDTFMRLGREQVEALVAERARAQELQRTLQIATILLLGLLSLSIVVAIGRGFRRVSVHLAGQRHDVEVAEQRYALVRDLDALLNPISRTVDDGAPAADVLAAVAAVLHGLHPDLRWTLPSLASLGSGVVTVTTAPNAKALLASDDLGALAGRAQDVIDAVRRRDHVLLSLESERRRDPLTLLANRLGFNEAVARTMREHSGRPVAVVLIDLDHFGDINGALGFAGADRVLIDVAGRLRSLADTAPGATLARIAADEYGIVLPLSSDGPGELFARRVQATCAFLSDAGGIEAAVTASVGVAVASYPQVDDAELLRRAAVAILLAKQSDRAGLVEFDPLQHAELSSSLDEELAVRNALRSGEFIMHYQPIVRIDGGRPLGCEALVRWERPGVGLVAPGDFLPLIERSGFAVEFGLEVLSEVLRAWSEGLRAAFAGCPDPGPYVSVNIDAAQLADPGFEAFVMSALQRSGVAPHDLVLELTEHEAVAEAHTAMLTRLRSFGVRIAIDDFGSGFSSLGQSTRLPLDLLKLDRSFIQSLRGDLREQQLFSDIARMARTLGLELTAEGIETEEVAATLLTAGISHGQGFLFSQAVPAPTLIEWVRERLGGGSGAATGSSAAQGAVGVLGGR
jgi:diguanylate cyclase (GGDEF)-like protein